MCVLFVCFFQFYGSFINFIFFFIRIVQVLLVFSVFGSLNLLKFLSVSGSPARVLALWGRCSCNHPHFCCKPNCLLSDFFLGCMSALYPKFILTYSITTRKIPLIIVLNWLKAEFLKIHAWICFVLVFPKIKAQHYRFTFLHCSCYFPILN